MKKLLYVSGAAIALAATPAMAQVTPDSESLVINLNGEVQSVCDLEPDGSTNYTVDMLDTGNQGSLVIAYSCNSPYEVRLSSLNGGMRHAESNGAVNIPYGIETIGFELPNGFSLANVTSTQIANNPTVVASVSDWQNILANAGVRYGELDLNFSNNPAQIGAAGTYSDELTVTLAAVW